MDKRLCRQKVFYPCKLIDSSINRLNILLKECLTFEAFCIEPRTTQKCYSQNNFSVEPKRQTPSSHKMPHNILKQISHDNFLKTDNKITGIYWKEIYWKGSFQNGKRKQIPSTFKDDYSYDVNLSQFSCPAKNHRTKESLRPFKGQPLISFVVAN